jgi:hypothetical protein
MAQSKLTDDHKLHIGECYSSGAWTQDRLAELYDVSRKTIYRVLSDLGLLQPREDVLSPGSARIVELVRSLGLDEHSLYQALNQPVLSRDNMVAVLAKMELADIEVLFNDVVQQKHLANHGTIPNESQLAANPDA